MNLIIDGEMFLGWLILSGFIDEATCHESGREMQNRPRKSYK